MNQCCKDTLQKLNNKVADLAEVLIKISGDRKTLMEEAAYRRAEVLSDIMTMIKEFAHEEMKK